MTDDPGKGFQADTALSDLFMAVLMAAERILAVVDVNRLQFFQTDDPVKFLQHLVQMMDDIVTGVIDMAGIQTDTHFLRQPDSVQDTAQFFKTPSYFRPFPGHGLQQHRRLLPRPHDFIEQFCNQQNPFLHSLTRMAARVKIIQIAGQIFHPPQVVLQSQPGKLPCLFLFGTGIQRVGRMGQHHRNLLLTGKFQKSFHIILIQLFRLAAAGIPGKKLKGIGADSHRLFSHM